MDAETQEIRQARQRASVKWLLSKAFNNRVPDNLKEPFYRDHENQERLKPQIVVEMGNATLYCQTLSNLYSDPNYQSLNHWSILQTLARKGVSVAETADMPITETVLIQTNPIRINAHMSVIESLMVLYAKEISSGDRIVAAIRRISGTNHQMPQNQTYEQSLLGWISHACASLKKRIVKEVETNLTDDNGIRLQTPDIPPVRDFQDLCDGISLAFLISYYCPKVLPWTSVRVNYLPAVEDSIHNILLVSSFSQKHLPYSVFHMTPEDITYMRGSMKLNLVLLLTDLFNVFEIHPANCVCYPDMESQVSYSNSQSANNLRSMPPPECQLIEPNNENNCTEAFVVHKSRGITTLSSMHSQQQEPLVPALLRQAKEKTIEESKADERGDYAAAGRPSNWEQNRRPSFAGRRSRRNSSSEDSQLTIENFGGSQDQLNTLGRYERDRDRERKLSNTYIEPAYAIRSSIVDARGTLQLGYDTDSGSEKQDRETEKYLIRRQASTDNVAIISTNNLSNVSSPLPSAKKPHSIDKDLKSGNNVDATATNVYEPETLMPVRKSSTSSMPASPATWQGNSADPYDEDLRSLENANKLSTIRLKLEEKRRRIEQDKRKIELALIRHQEKEDLESGSDMVKWETMSNESKRTPDMDPIDLDKYQQQQTYGSQQHLADHHCHQRPMQQNFGSSPHLPQSVYSAVQVSGYSSRPPSRDPYQQQQMQPMPVQYVNEHGQYMTPQQQPPQPIMQQSPLYMQPQSIYSDNSVGGNGPPYNNQSYGGSLGQTSYGPSVPQQYGNRQSSIYDDYGQPVNHFYLHETSPQPQHHSQQRRTWAHSAAAAAYEHQHIQPLVDVNAWQTQQQKKSQAAGSWINRPQSTQGFVLHQNGSGVGGELQHLFQVQSSPQNSQRMISGNVGISDVQRQQSLTNLRDNRSPNAMSSKASSAPGPTPQEDMMAPQSICFIGDEEDVDEIERNIIESMKSTRISDFVLQQQQQQQMHLAGGRGSTSEDDIISNKLNITSGNLTYRIPSPSRPSLQVNSFQDPRIDERTEKGFYISFDDEQPKRPKPPLRPKRSPKKEKTNDNVDNQVVIKRESLSRLHNNNNSTTADAKKTANQNTVKNNFVIGSNNATYNKYTDEPPIHIRQLHLIDFDNSSSQMLDRRHLEDVTNQQQAPLSPTQQINFIRQLQTVCSNAESKNKALLIGSDEATLDRESVDEMERRKEKIMLLSLQRRQQQEEAKARKEIESSQKREKDRAKEEERVRKKEEQLARRAAILEQHRLKKAIEEAEREGKTLDRTDLQSKQSITTVPRLRQQKLTRPRPKTIHVDDASVDISEASSISSRGKKGSSLNLTGHSQIGSNSMNRDYYKGSQDSLTIKESPDDYPSTSSTPIGRRGSYKTSRGPKLYKQPAAKSNRGIILNAVEYCVFPGAVNREAKQKVLEKIARSEAKHFLVLFRDAGCQFRALYSYIPETDQVSKLYGTGPSQVDEVMFDKFFKYNSGGKCFSQVHTKHLTVTIDAFTIHNSLWQGKKVHLPSKKDMALVI